MGYKILKFQNEHKLANISSSNSPSVQEYIYFLWYNENLVTSKLSFYLLQYFSKLHLYPFLMYRRLKQTHIITYMSAESSILSFVVISMKIWYQIFYLLLLHSINPCSTNHNCNSWHFDFFLFVPFFVFFCISSEEMRLTFHVNHAESSA